MTGTCTKDHTGVHMFMDNYAKGGAVVGSKVDMHTCSDACTHSNQVAGQEDYPGIDSYNVTTYKISNGGTVVSPLVSVSMSM